MIALLVCESMLWKCDSVSLDVDMSLPNASGVRIDILQGGYRIDEQTTAELPL